MESKSEQEGKRLTSALFDTLGFQKEDAVNINNKHVLNKLFTNSLSERRKSI